MVKTVRVTRRVLTILEAAADLYKTTFEEIGGCDHSVGICCCDIEAQYEDLVKYIEALKEAFDVTVIPEG